jgi:capping protein beta
MRKLEIQANEAFDTYRELYYEGGVSSVYLWDPEDPSGAGNFAGVVVIKKGELIDKYEIRVISDSRRSVMNPNTAWEPSGSWDSIHVFEAVERGRQAHYKLTSTVMLQLVTKAGSDSDSKSSSEKRGTESWKRDGEVSLSGSMTRQVRFYLRMSRMIVEPFERPSKIGPCMIVHLISVISVG